MFVLFFVLPLVSGLTPDQFDLLMKSINVIEQKLDVLVPAYDLYNFTSIEEIYNLVPVEYQPKLKIRGVPYDFEFLLFDTELAVEIIGYGVSYTLPSYPKCDSGVPKTGSFMKGILQFAPPKVCVFDEPNRALLFDFPLQMQILLMQKTNYYWSFSINQPSTLDFPTNNYSCSGYNLITSNPTIRFYQGQQLNLTDSFDISDLQTSVINIAQSQFEGTDITSNYNYTDWRLALRRYGAQYIYDYTLGKLVTVFDDWSTSCLNDSITFSYHNPVLSKDLFVTVPNTTMQVIAYDYQSKEVFASTFAYPKFTPVKTDGGGSATTYRPSFTITSSNHQMTFNNSFIPVRDTIIMLSIRYYLQDAYNVLRNCYAQPFSFTQSFKASSYFLPMGGAEIDQVQDATAWANQHINPFVTDMVDIKHVPQNPTVGKCEDGAPISVLTTCTAKNAPNTEHTVLMRPHLHIDPHLTYSAHPFLLKSRPFSFMQSYYDDSGTLQAMNRTFYVPSVASFTPHFGALPKAVSPYVDPSTWVPAKVKSIAQTLQQTLDDVKTVISDTWAWIERINAVVGELTSIIEFTYDLGKSVWELGLPKNFWGFLDDSSTLTPELETFFELLPVV